MVVKKKGSTYVVLSRDGKKLLGNHRTKKEAMAQLRAIEASKARKKSKK